MFDVLDLMRAELRPVPSLPDHSRRRWKEINPIHLHHGNEAARLMFSNQRLQVSTDQQFANNKIGMQLSWGQARTPGFGEQGI